MLPHINTVAMHDLRHTDRSASSRQHQGHHTDTDLFNSKSGSRASGIRLVPKVKKPSFPEAVKNNVKIHLSCSDAMRQTQYNKLVNAVNKFDTQRIK